MLTDDAGSGGRASRRHSRPADRSRGVGEAERERDGVGFGVSLARLRRRKGKFHAQLSRPVERNGMECNFFQDGGG